MYLMLFMMWMHVHNYRLLASVTLATVKINWMPSLVENIIHDVIWIGQ